MDEQTRDLILSVFESSLEAQLRAIRRLRNPAAEPDRRRRPKRMSNVDMAYEVLSKAGAPLHASRLIECIHAQFGVAVDRESLVSALAKKVARRDRFTRPARNTFAVISDAR